MLDFIISGPQVYTEKKIEPNSSVAIANDKIHALDAIQNNSAIKHFTFPADYHLVPGFIDLHIHGANGADVMDGTLNSLETISAALAKEGVTGFLATTMTATTDKINHVLAAIAEFSLGSQPGARLLGVHLEGPFLSPNKVGAQCADWLTWPDIEDIKHWQKKSANSIKVITLAPELANSLECIRFLKKHHIVASIGHSDATYAETIAAIDAGCSHVTHVFNAMRGIHHREPGVVTAALLDDDVSVELILDGAHLHPAIVQLILKTKRLDKIILVTDAMRAKCLADGKYDLGGLPVDVKKGIARLENGTLAGSTLNMPQAIRNMCAFSRCDFFQAVKFVTENPAKALGMFATKGSIAVGKDADLVVLDNNFEVVMTVRGGKVIFSQEAD